MHLSRKLCIWSRHLISTVLLSEAWSLCEFLTQMERREWTRDVGCGFKGCMGRMRCAVCEGALQLPFLLGAGAPGRAQRGWGSWWDWTCGFPRERPFRGLGLLYLRKGGASAYSCWCFWDAIWAQMALSWSGQWAWKGGDSHRAAVDASYAS